MLVLVDKEGQLCNRLWSYAPFIAYALHHDIAVRVLYLGPYHEAFEDLGRFPRITFPEWSSRSYDYLKQLTHLVHRLPRSLRRALRVDSLRFGDPAYERVKPLDRDGLVLVQSWRAPVPQRYMQSEHDRIRELFRFRRESTTKVDALLSRELRPDDILVGIHLRRGDYATYRDGEYYYDDATYAAFLRQLPAQFPGKRLRVLLCSNEAIRPEAFAEFAHFSVPDATGVEDLYALSRCDYIMGPPSTYSMWASYYGRVPLLFLESAATPVKREDFSVIIHQNHFANGRVLYGESR
ncbi:hypothetical protein CLV84_0956 [Neolewinella xylanilytica]|uniref:Glycosyl transferase family 11 n=1 Tax=Neolewinella xylanilytica TaxID=1514080 RepID=A0A2S6I917_9BACT|nr:hypothetical protein [Neolewinella xylanilytica]PPK87994.1 hypothetical protein CLV84_0956 [Neolewinella xylanilytica]